MDASLQRATETCHGLVVEDAAPPPENLASTYSDNELYFRTLLMVRWFKVGLQGVEGITMGKEEQRIRGWMA